MQRKIAEKVSLINMPLFEDKLEAIKNIVANNELEIKNLNLLADAQSLKANEKKLKYLAAQNKLMQTILDAQHNIQLRSIAIDVYSSIGRAINHNDALSAETQYDLYNEGSKLLGMVELGVRNPQSVANFKALTDAHQKLSYRNNHWQAVGGGLLVLASMGGLIASVAALPLTLGLPFVTCVLISLSSICIGPIVSIALLAGGVATIKDAYKEKPSPLSKNMNSFWSAVKPFQPSLADQASLKALNRLGR